MYVTRTHVEEGRAACEALARYRGFETVRLISELKTAPWALGNGGRTLEVGKAETRSTWWKRYETYRFSLKHWRGIQEHARRYDVPPFLVVTWSDGTRGWMRVDDSIWAGPPSRRGSRSVNSRGDVRDPEDMVQVNWSAIDVFERGEMYR